MRGSRAIKVQLVGRLRQRTPNGFVLMVRRFTETPYNLDRGATTIRRSVRRLVLRL